MNITQNKLTTIGILALTTNLFAGSNHSTSHLVQDGYSTATQPLRFDQTQMDRPPSSSASNTGAASDLVQVEMNLEALYVSPYFSEQLFNKASLLFDKVNKTGKFSDPFFNTRQKDSMIKEHREISSLFTGALLGGFISKSLSKKIRPIVHMLNTIAKNLDIDELSDRIRIILPLQLYKQGTKDVDSECVLITYRPHEGDILSLDEIKAHGNGVPLTPNALELNKKDLATIVNKLEFLETIIETQRTIIDSLNDGITDDLVRTDYPAFLETSQFQLEKIDSTLLYLRNALNTIKRNGYDEYTMTIIYILLKSHMTNIGVSADICSEMASLLDGLYVNNFIEVAVKYSPEMKDFYYWIPRESSKRTGKTIKIEEISKKTKDFKSYISTANTQLAKKQKFQINPELTRMLNEVDRLKTVIKKEKYDSLFVNSSTADMREIGLLSHIGYYFQIVHRHDASQDAIIELFNNIKPLICEDEKAINELTNQSQTRQQGRKNSKQKKDTVRETKTVSDEATLYAIKTTTVSDETTLHTTLEAPQETHTIFPSDEDNVHKLRTKEWKEKCEKMRLIKKDEDFFSVVSTGNYEVGTSHSFDTSLLEGSPDLNNVYNEFRRVGACVLINPNKNNKDFIYWTHNDKKYIFVIHQQHGIDKGRKFAHYRQIKAALNNAG